MWNGVRNSLLHGDWYVLDDSHGVGLGYWDRVRPADGNLYCMMDWNRHVTVNCDRIRLRDRDGHSVRDGDVSADSNGSSDTESWQ